MKFLFFNLAVAAVLGYIVFMHNPVPKLEAATNAVQDAVSGNGVAAAAPEKPVTPQTPFLPEISSALEKLNSARQEDTDKRLSGIEDMLAALQDSNARLATLMEDAKTREGDILPEVPVSAAPVAEITPASPVAAAPVVGVSQPAPVQAPVVLEPVSPAIAALLEEPAEPVKKPEQVALAAPPVPEIPAVDEAMFDLPDEEEEEPQFMSQRDRQRELANLAEDMEMFYVSRLGE